MRQTKYKQSKTEASNAQSKLQKEITSLRDAYRTLQLKLRDIEVANDDFERQARNTTSSLEDLESKHNVAIERAVMMEEEIKIGEQERENLRIETQRLRDELSDLKIEAEIMQDKLRKQSERAIPPLSMDLLAASSPMRGSPRSDVSSPMITTPPDTKSVSTVDTVSETPTPPSPPMSEASTSAKNSLRTPMNAPRSKLRAPSGEYSATPRPSKYATPGARAGRTSAATKFRPNPSIKRSGPPPTAGNKPPMGKGLPNSTSLNHIRTLTAQMQRLEQRVQNAKSRLPGPKHTPPRASPRHDGAQNHAHMPSSVTIRSRKRTGGSSIASSLAEETPSSTRVVGRISTSGISRLSFGPRDSQAGDSRPSSRSSVGNSQATGSIPRPASRTEPSRPESRTSVSGSRTPSSLGHYMADARRPRSSMGGNFAASHGGGHGHGHSHSVSGVDIDEVREMDFSTSMRRSVVRSEEGAGIPTPGAKRANEAFTQSTTGRTPRRTATTSTSALRDHARREEASKLSGRPRKLSGVGETF